MKTGASPIADAGAYAHLCRLVPQLAAADNTARQAGEKELQEKLLKSAPQLVLPALCQVARDADDAHVRSLACVLFRRFATKPSVSDGGLLGKIGADPQKLCVYILNSALLREADASVRRKLADTVADVCRFAENEAEAEEEEGEGAVDGSGSALGPLFLPTLAQLAQSPHIPFRQTSFQVLGGVPSLFAHVPAPQIAPLFDSAFAQSSRETLELQSSALRAALALMEHDAELSAAAGLRVIHHAVAVVRLALEAASLDPSCESFKEVVTTLIDFVPENVKLFRPVFADLAQLSLALVEQAERTPDSVADDAKHLAMELLVTFTESLPPLMRKHPALVSRMVGACVRWMSNLDDSLEEEWFNCEKLEDADEDADSDPVNGESALDRISRALGGATVLPVAFSLIPTALADRESWKQRRAGLYTIATIAEGCSKLLSKEVTKLLPLIVPHLDADPEQRVQYAACQCVGQLFTDFGPQLQKQHHQPLMASLLGVFAAERNPPAHQRVRAHAAAAIINFLECGTKTLALRYMEPIVRALLPVFHAASSGTEFIKPYLLEQALTTLATVAESTGRGFAKVGAEVVNVGLQLLESAGTAAYETLRGRTVECISLCAVAMEAEHFRPFLEPVIRLFSTLR